MARGYATKSKGRRIAVTIPEDLFHRINKRARTKQVPFSDIAADMIKCGELCIVESERDEPEHLETKQ
jgi:hypothetical protein